MSGQANENYHCINGSDSNCDDDRPDAPLNIYKVNLVLDAMKHKNYSFSGEEKWPQDLLRDLILLKKNCNLFDTNIINF